MANRPANAGSGSIGTGDVAPPFDAAAPPLPVHHDAFPRPGTPRATAQAHAGPAHAAPAPAARTRLTWLPYLIVLAGVAAGIAVAWQGSKRAAPGVAVVGCSLLAAALARLILPDRYAGLLASRRKALDVLAFAVLGAAVLAVVLSLP
jgi:Protein of unknown function (DUF3017)